jgi:hypothetical protein
MRLPSLNLILMNKRRLRIYFERLKNQKNEKIIKILMEMISEKKNEKMMNEKKIIKKKMKNLLTLRVLRIRLRHFDLVNLRTDQRFGYLCEIVRYLDDDISG